MLWHSIEIEKTSKDTNVNSFIFLIFLKSIIGSNHVKNKIKSRTIHVPLIIKEVKIVTL